MEITVGDIERLAKEQSPSRDSAFVASIMGKGSRIEEGKPFWTGWKADIGRYCSNRSLDAVVEFPEGPIGYVGQWVCLSGSSAGEVNFSMSIPGMVASIFERGGSFDIGSERVYRDTLAEELERLIEDGHAKLMDFMAAEKSKAA